MRLLPTEPGRRAPRELLVRPPRVAPTRPRSAPGSTTPDGAIRSGGAARWRGRGRSQPVRC
jgi:hypothetical protein